MRYKSGHFVKEGDVVHYKGRKVLYKVQRIVPNGIVVKSLRSGMSYLARRPLNNIVLKERAWIKNKGTRPVVTYRIDCMYKDGDVSFNLDLEKDGRNIDAVGIRCCAIWRLGNAPGFITHYREHIPKEGDARKPKSPQEQELKVLL